MANGYDPSPGDLIIENDLSYITETVCIITDKVYSHCQQRECFPEISVEIDPNDPPVSITFQEGFIVEGSLIVTDIPNRPNFKRVRFTIRIPYQITTQSGATIDGFLPDIFKDIVLFIPDSRDEFNFRIVVETSSRLLGDFTITGNMATFAVGVFVIVKVVGRVQLLIPAYGFCPEPPACEEFNPSGVCETFEYEPFPDFFPPQFEDLYPNGL